MVVLAEKVLVLAVILCNTCVMCDWVEIPQSFHKHIPAQIIKIDVGHHNIENTSDLLTYTEILQDHLLLQGNLHKTQAPINNYSENKQILKITSINQLSTMAPDNITAVSEKSDRRPFVNSTYPRNNGTNRATKKPTDFITPIDENIKTTDSSPLLFNFDSFLKIIENMQKAFLKNTPTTVKGKTRYLRSIHDDILMNIEDRIDALWPVSPTQDDSRTEKHDDGHVDFPSAESALMTISFLTFAVFLIKLVLQVIQSIKDKQQMQVFTAVGKSYDNHRMVPRSIAEDTQFVADVLSTMENYGIKMRNM